LREVKASNAKAIADDKEALEAFYVTHPGIAAGGLSAMGMFPTSCAFHIGTVSVFGTLTKICLVLKGDLQQLRRKLRNAPHTTVGTEEAPL
jgi:hypothetical protein